MTKVEITTPGLTVTVEANVDLDVAATKALDLYREVHQPGMTPPRLEAGGLGFTIERDVEGGGQ